MAFVLREMRRPELVCDTGVLDTLYQEVLAEGIENYQRRNDHKTTRVTNSGLIKRLSRIAQLQGRRNRANQVNKQLVRGFDTRVEQAYVEVIGPLPAECKQEYGDHHGDGQRKNDLNEGTESSRTVHVRRLLKLIRHATEELAQKEDIQAVLECKTAKREEQHREVGITQVNTCLGDIHLNLVLGHATSGFVFAPLNNVGQDVDLFKECRNSLAKLLDVVTEQLNSAALEQLYDTEQVKVTELHKHGELQGLVRNDHGQNNQQEQQVSALELKLCKSVTDQAADKGLHDCRQERKRKGGRKGIPVSQIGEDRLVNVQ